MDLGLSSVLDLTDEEDVYQKYIFSKQEWKQLKDYFNKNINLILHQLFIDTWSTVAQLAINRGTLLALKYISKIQSLELTNEANFIYLEIFKHTILVLHEDAYLINGIIENNGSISEQEVNTIWVPTIIKKVVLIKKIIRTTKRKQARYFDHENVKEFKIDVRLLLDYDRNEIDLCAGEVAISAFDTDKIVRDRSKLIRESKEITMRPSY